MDTIATSYDPKPVSPGKEPRNDSGEIRNSRPDEIILGTHPHSDKEEHTDYSYDPDDEWIEMHLGRKMEENY